MKKFILALSMLCISVNVNAQAYIQTTVVSGLSNPVAFDIAPDGRFFCTQKGGVSGMAVDAIIKVYSSTGTFISNFYNLTDSCNSDFERGLLGIELDPDFATNNYVYAYYNHNYGGDERIRIVRFTEVANVGTNPTMIFDLDVSNSIPGNHVGGNLHFRPSQPNHLYLTIGDLAYQQGNATLNYANKLVNPYGKVLRINKNGTVPTDNPYYDDGNPLATNCDWIWSYGHRNPFDFCFNTSNDSMYVAENGWNSWDEADVIHKGANYGWANCEGNHVNGSTTVLCSTPNVVAPITTWGSPLPAVTGILFYNHPAWPALYKHLLIADNDYGRIYDCTMGNAPAYDVVSSRVQLGDFTTGGLTSLRASVSDSCFYAMKGGYTSTGAIYKVCPPLSASINQNANVIGEAIVAPNPTSGIVNVEFILNTATEVSFQLTDIAGRIIFTEAFQSFKAGVNEIQLNLNQRGVANGLFFLKIKSGKENNLGEKVIKIVKE